MSSTTASSGEPPAPRVGQVWRRRRPGPDGPGRRIVTAVEGDNLQSVPMTPDGPLLGPAPGWVYVTWFCGWYQLDEDVTR